MGFNTSGNGLKNEFFPYSNSDMSFTPLTKFCFGFSFNRKWKKNLNIEIQTLFITRHEEFEGEYGASIPFSGLTSITQLEIPVLLKWTFLRRSKIDGHLFTGFGLISVTDHNISSTYNNINGEFIEKNPGGGFVLGFGVDYYRVKRMMTFDIRFSFGDVKSYEIIDDMTNNPVFTGEPEFTTGSIIIGYYF